jgi:hypothetical protein
MVSRRSNVEGCDTDLGFRLLLFCPTTSTTAIMSHYSNVPAMDKLGRQDRVTGVSSAT